jgi:hypothetical protein
VQYTETVVVLVVAVLAAALSIQLVGSAGDNVHGVVLLTAATSYTMRNTAD